MNMPAPLNRGLRSINIHPTVFLRSLLDEDAFNRVLAQQRSRGEGLHWRPVLGRICAERTRQQAAIREAIDGAEQVKAWTAIPFMGTAQVKAWEKLAQDAGLMVFCQNVTREGAEPFWVVQGSDNYISVQAVQAYLQIAAKLSGEEAAPSSKLLYTELVSQMVRLRLTATELETLADTDQIGIFLYVSRRSNRTSREIRKLDG